MKNKKRYYPANYLLLLIMASTGHAATIANGEVKELDDKNEILDLDNLYIRNGKVLIKSGTLETNNTVITDFFGESGSVTVSGSDSIWNNKNALNLGVISLHTRYTKTPSKSGIDILNGAQVYTDKFSMGNYRGTNLDEEAQYTLNVDGKGSILKVNQDLTASSFNSNRFPIGIVTINIDNDGVIEAENVVMHDMGINYDEASLKTVLNIKNNGLLNVKEDVYFAKNFGNADPDTPSELNILSGGKIKAKNFHAGLHKVWSDNSPVSLLISGKDSSIDVSENFTTGGNLRSLLTVKDGAEINAKNIILGTGDSATVDPYDINTPHPTVIVTGEQSKITAQNHLILGDNVNHEITIADGGLVSAEEITLGKTKLLPSILGRSTLNLLAGGNVTTHKINLNKDSNYFNAVIYHGDGGLAGELNTKSIEGFTGKNNYQFNGDKLPMQAGLVFNYQNDNDFSPNLINTINVVKNNTNTITFAGNNSEHSGVVVINDGALKAGNQNAFGSRVDVKNFSQFDLNGFGQTISSLDNRGVVKLSRDDQTQTHLNILNDYKSDNGSLYFNTELGGDDSKTDKLIINGDSTGNTTVYVNNIHGKGAQTETGIELITVADRSLGEFKQSGRIVAGAYDYTLLRGGYVPGTNYKNWYLTSLYVEPPVDPVDPVKPVDPVDPVKPVDPVDPVKPVDPVDPVKPVDPVDP
ncbi:TPA: autotransporter outer membrane beta-barrel domain-containing protein, partial [Providencia alcalifaciens]